MLKMMFRFPKYFSTRAKKLISISNKVPPVPHKYFIDPSKNANKTNIVHDWFVPQSVKIAIIGANERAGQAAALYLKQHKIVKKLYLFDENDIKYITKNLEYVDTKCAVSGFDNNKDISEVLRPADIVIILDNESKNSDIAQKFYSVAPRLKRIINECILHAPKAVLIICVEPLCCTIPFAQTVLQQSTFYHPSRLVGCVAPLQSRVNTIVARYLDLDPVYVNVPLLGGTDQETMIPLVSLITPSPILCSIHLRKLYDLIIEKSAIQKDLETENTLLCEGIAIAELAVIIAKGICGYTDSHAPVVIRNNIFQTINYIILMVRFGFGGIIYNYGIPKISKFEVEKFDKVASILQARQKIVKEYLIEKNEEVVKEQNFCRLIATQ